MTQPIQYDQPLELAIKLDQLTLAGNLMLPNHAQRIVLFAHGSSSSRLSPRNQYVAKILNQAGIATLLFDLLTTEEDMIDQQTAEFRFNIPLLAQRLIATTDWFIQQSPDLNNMHIGYFGASTGAAAALIAAAERSTIIRAVVSRGGRPDLAKDALAYVTAPTLMIVGGLDEAVIEMNQEAQADIPTTTRTKLTIVSAATHLFEEEGKLEQVAQLALDWFNQFL